MAWWMSCSSTSSTAASPARNASSASVFEAACAAQPECKWNVSDASCRNSCGRYNNISVLAQAQEEANRTLELARQTGEATKGIASKVRAIQGAATQAGEAIRQALDAETKKGTVVAVGHSYGGLLGAQILMTEPGMFMVEYSSKRRTSRMAMSASIRSQSAVFSQPGVAACATAPPIHPPPARASASR